MSIQSLYILVIFDILKWTILIYFIARFVLRIEDSISGGGFLISKNEIPVLRSIPIGVVAAIFAVIIVMVFLIYYSKMVYLRN